ncbi:WD repeat-containing protein [Plasmodium brasilianum]|uniref:Uncharacterized protein n=2 Tax=Plasmodium (Plasmodium) TaxID=418103 RepID=A0A1A8WFH3_PLAMA|nr:conserved Plasmodium protein, unknown function [Plasmodium malariae]KAI4834910.1 WD repeat-containing protein [Plasmodium brasilianum]SBS90811.1 hypothetical protein, conserved [Plasmodium malariae]SCP03478.1 conserved Plasmodium protein, unknown function [Plasmodium malariae]
MKKEFAEYNKKFFRNIQFIYDFLDKIGMKSSLEELKKESKINYVKEYDKYIFEDATNYNSDDETNSNDCLNDNLSDELDIDYSFFIHTIDKMHNSILCKAIDNFESTLKQKNKSNININEDEKKDNICSEYNNFYLNNDYFPCCNKKEHSIKVGDNEIEKKKEEYNNCNEDNLEKENRNIQIYDKKNDKEGRSKENNNTIFNDSCVLRKIGEKVKDISALSRNNMKLPLDLNTKLHMDVTVTPHIDVEKKSSNEVKLTKEKRSINNFPYKFENENNSDMNNKKVKNCNLNDTKCRSNTNEDSTKQNSTEDIKKKSKLLKNETHNWDKYFTYEREISKKLKVKYINNAVDNKNEANNGEDISLEAASNILVIKYIDIYNMDTCKNMRFENIIFFKIFLPILILVGYADGNVKLFLTLYEKGDNENNLEECVHLCKELYSVSLGSPIMFIDINYKDDIFIVSTMHGDVYICHINMNNISMLIKYIELKNSIDEIKNNIKGDQIYISIMKTLKYHNKYSIKCLFNDDYAFFCSIANDKNLIIYEKIVNKIEESVTYEKKKVIGLPEIPTSVLWVKENNDNYGNSNSNGSNIYNNKETIVVSMLNSNNILFINSKTFNIENKIYLFDSTEKYNILNLEYNKNKNILVICTDTSIIFVYSLIKKTIIRKIYGCVLNSLSFPTLEVDINGNNIYVTSEDSTNGSHILIFDIKSGNIIDVINNGYKIRCFQLLKSYICPFSNETNSNNIEENKKSLLILGSFDKKIHFYSN